MTHRRVALAIALCAVTGCQAILGVEDTRLGSDDIDAGPSDIDAGGADVDAGPTGARCGDFNTDPGETCDDGNEVTGDGCSAACQDETVFCRPTNLGRITRNNPGRMVADGNLLYVATRFQTSFPVLRIYDVTDPANPVARGTFSHDMDNFPNNKTLGIVKHGNHVWLAGDNPELFAVDVTDPDAPAQGFIRGPNTNDGHLALLGDILIVSTSVAEKASVFDITNDASPVTLNSIGDPSVPYYNVAAAGSTAYLTNFGNRMDVVDMSDPTGGTVVGRYSHATPWSGIRAVSRIVADSDTVAISVPFGAAAGIHLIDTTLATAPNFAATITESAQDLALVDDLLYVPTNDGVRVYDVSDPESPVLAGSFVSLDHFGTSVAVADGRVYVGGESDILVVDGLPGVCRATCGNTVVEYPEECDDGNRADGDGCSATCEGR